MPEGVPSSLRPEALAAVDVVGEALRRAAAGPGAVYAKHGRDVVTDTDVDVEDHVREVLSRRFGWPVTGEERGGAIPDDGPCWLVDPICGTRNYASGIPLYAVNVALVEGGDVSLAVVGDGSTGMIAVAERDRGAWSVLPHRKRLRSDDASATVDLGAWPRSPATRAHAGRRAAALIEADLWDVRSFSTTLSLAYVAAGRLAGCVLFRTPGVVHTAAGALLVAEAGGTVTDIEGRGWTLASGSLLCAATPELHRQLLRLMA